ncbi:MAG: hypothetical protein N4A36_01770 [Candidatus Gracilibacteria bacterium]|jgi:XTP/dITP diphosphohydrolase|nr:hypothetical protein [Candidatus Gracilibacteria bacterium]
MKILLATGNQGKAKEMMEVLRDLDCEFVTLKDLGLPNDVMEDGETYRENAFKKAYHFYKKTGLPTIGEDSGIQVDALEGELGIHTRRWGAGEEASDIEWLDYFLDRMKDENNRRSRFFCTACFVFDNIEKYFEDSTEGNLSKEPLCEIPQGIPMSAVFVADGETKAYAQMTREEKNAISHRGKTMSKLSDFLKKFIYDRKNA